MAHDPSAEKSPADPRMASRHLLLAGVAAACVLGVGLGLWARPAMNERRMALAPRAAPSPAPAANRSIRIVVDDRPAPLGTPIEVLPTAGAPVPQMVSIAPAPLPEPTPEPQVPARPPAGLVRVRATAPQPAEPPRPPRAEPRPAERPARIVKAKAPAKAVAEKPRAQKVKLVRPDPRPDRSAKDRTRRTPAASPSRARAEQRAEAGHTPRFAPTAKPQKARLDRAKPTKVRVEKVRLEKVRLDKARPEKARPEKARLDRAKRHKAAPAPPPRLQKAVARPAPRKPLAPPVRAAHPARGEGPLRFVSVRRCATMACGDPAISAADRQMNRAYADARAAGVPDARLRQQQQHWQAARATAAREAPWAVRDVYLARIAELNDQARARDNGY